MSWRKETGNPAKFTFPDAFSQGSRGALFPVFPFSFPTLALPSLFPVPVSLFILVCLPIASFQGTKQTGRKGESNLGGGKGKGGTSERKGRTRIGKKRGELGKGTAGTLWKSVGKGKSCGISCFFPPRHRPRASLFPSFPFSKKGLQGMRLCNPGTPGPINFPVLRVFFSNSSGQLGKPQVGGGLLVLLVFRWFFVGFTWF